MNRYEAKFIRGGFDKRPPNRNRSRMVTEFAWAVPNDEAIAALVELSPLVEIGSGTGYWASLIHAAGGEIKCYDKDPPLMGGNINSHTVEYDPPGVWEGTPAKLGEHPNDTLFLCWPPMGDPMAADCLRLFPGVRAAIVADRTMDEVPDTGEKIPRCGDVEFWQMLDTGWTLERTVEIPQWYGCHDALYIYARMSGKS